MLRSKLFTHHQQLYVFRFQFARSSCENSSTAVRKVLFQDWKKKSCFAAYIRVLLAQQFTSAHILSNLAEYTVIMLNASFLLKRGAGRVSNRVCQQQAAALIGTTNIEGPAILKSQRDIEEEEKHEHKFGKPEGEVVFCNLFCCSNAVANDHTSQVIGVLCCA